MSCAVNTTNTSTLRQATKEPLDTLADVSDVCIFSSVVRGKLQGGGVRLSSGAGEVTFYVKQSVGISLHLEGI